MKELFNKIEQIEVFNKFFSKLLKQNNHAYLLTSQSSLTLKLFVQYFLMKVNCLDENKPCCECSNCLKILNDNCIDVRYYPTKNSVSVEDVLSMIDEVNVKPMDLKNRFFIFNNLENSSFQAQNKLLKTLEEPPANVVFILTTTQPENILLTIKSRVVKMEIPALSQSDLPLFKNYFEMEDDLNLAFKLGNGNVGDLLDKTQFEQMKSIYQKSLEVLGQLRKSSDVNNATQQIVKQKGESVLFLKCFEIIFRDVMMKLIFEHGERKFNEELDVKACLNIIDKIENANEKLQANATEIGVIDELLLTILEEKYLCKQR